MSMTREEAIKVLNNFPIDFRNSGGFEAMEALKIAILALRPVSREQVEKVWRAHWNESVHLGGLVYCSRCGYNALEANNYTFCPKCGRPFTDEAVGMVMERLEGMDNGTVPCDNA